MRNADDMTDPKRSAQPAPSRSVVRAMIWATVPVLLLVQLLASAGVEVSSFWSQIRQLDARIARTAESRAELIAEPLWKMRYDQVTNVLNEIMHDETIAAAAVYDDTGVPIARVVARPADQSVSEVSRPISYTNGNIAVQAGRIVIAYSYATVYADTGSRLMLLLVVGLLATFATLIAMRISANIFIGKPLAAIMSAIQRSKQDGRAYPADIKSLNEFGQLARAFNAMQHTTSGALDRLGHMAAHDPLTGLPNRRSLSEHLVTLSNDAGSPDSLIAFCFIDLDDFKGINDTFGHDAGDKFLVHISERLRDAVEPQDWVARLGGDEFVVIRPEVSNQATAQAFARHLLDAISEPIRLHDKQVVPRASIGLAVRRAADPELSHLPALADIALYHAKSKAPGTVAVLDEALQRDYRRRRDLELAIPTGFAEGQFEVWYQSQVDLESQAVVGLEALIRWRHPEHGIIGPGEFLPLIERSGNNARLTRYVLTDACRALQRLAAAGRPEIRVAINLPPSELADHSLAAELRTTCRNFNVAASSLELEITEGSLINNIASASETLHRLRRLGATIALDDFGTGYSSLAHLRRFPLDKVKIDKAFISEIPGSAEDKAIVGVIASLAGTLGLTLVAEGIERAEQAAAMREMGVRFGQGYLYQRPQPLEAVLQGLEGQPREARVRIDSPPIAPEFAA
ncbi:sensor domain-containing phosphodiesterase [Bradyrhizobium sp.]|jgi:diguanylate cyclase (GGDEF)-like protein|uniref:putative bifunctional diguanylate cyclase/phosphodiesterase n=1 Tax=Bradyrhizobium sp. TaxID=376 RepID=UPI002DDD81CD|nr:sensor domain-containing phosphodiesterase [Bradyrhizobium sp.]HEV2157299.1 sensor domain-containing phosphodiesterase [Bradyrhizobium sp.]